MVFKLIGFNKTMATTFPLKLCLSEVMKTTPLKPT